MIPGTIHSAPNSEENRATIRKGHSMAQSVSHSPGTADPPPTTHVQFVYIC